MKGAFNQLNRDEVSELTHWFQINADDGTMMASVGALLRDLLTNTAQEAILDLAPNGRR